MTLDATVAGPDANSYIDATEADDYAAGDPVSGDAWLAASDDDKDRALIAAANDVDLYRRAGTRYAVDQALLFPRDVDYTGTPAAPFLLADVRRAAYEQAVYLLVNHKLIASAGTRRARALFNFSDDDGSGQPALDPNFGLYAPKMIERLERIGAERRGRPTIRSVPMASSFS